LLVEVPARGAAYADRANHIGSDAYWHAATLAAGIWLARSRETLLSVRMPTFVVESGKHECDEF